MWRGFVRHQGPSVKRHQAIVYMFMTGPVIWCISPFKLFCLTIFSCVPKPIFTTWMPRSVLRNPDLVQLGKTELLPRSLATSDHPYHVRWRGSNSAVSFPASTCDKVRAGVAKAPIRTRVEVSEAEEHFHEIFYGPLSFSNAIGPGRLKGTLKL